MEEKAFLDKLKKQERILIYGAGMVGGLVYNRICAAGLEKRIVGFVVTKRNNEEQSYLEKPIIELEYAKDNCRDCLVIIATLPNLHMVMEKLLIECKLHNYLKVDRELFHCLSESYVDDFEVKWEENRDKIDIIFMASDNNRSSGAFLSMTDLNYVLNQRGISTLIVLPEYGNGESILKEKGLSYTYILSEHWAIKNEEEYDSYKRQRISENDKAVAKLRELIQRYHVRLIHNNTTYTYVGALAAMEENVPYVWHLRETIEDQGNRFLDRKKSIMCINKADRVITISNFMKNHIEGLDTAKVDVVYNGIDVNKMYIEEKPIFINKEIIITIVGVLLPYKGQHELIQAAGILLKRGYSDFKIRLVGNDVSEYTQNLHDMVNDLKLGNHVEFMGRREDMKAVYLQTDIAVSCCPIEAFGRVTVEGQLSGSLVIGINTGATVELIEDGETGLLYQAGEPETLADCIEKSMNNPERAREIARKGQKYARNNFTKEKNEEGIIRVYQKILRNKLML